jgi:hypothetical protein
MSVAAEGRFAYAEEAALDEDYFHDPVEGVTGVVADFGRSGADAGDGVQA